MFSGCRSDQAQTESPISIQTVTPEPVLTISEDLTPKPSITPEIVPEDISEEIISQDNYLNNLDPSGEVVTFWHPFRDNQVKALQDIILSFNDTNEWGITVEEVYQGGYEELQDKMLTFMNSKDAPNLIVVNETQAAIYQLAEALIDIDQLANHTTWGLTEVEKNDFFTGLYDQGVYPSFGRLRLSFPMYGTMNVLYYNADWMAEAGYNNPPGSPEAFLEASCIASGQPFSGATADGMVGYHLAVKPSSFADWSYAFGGKIFDFGRDQYILDSSPTINAMTYLQDLLNRGCASTLPSAGGDLVDFGSGVSLFTIESVDKISTIRSMVQDNANFNWRIAPLPHRTNQPVTIATGISASIPKTTPESQLAAWLFLKYFSTPEIQARWVKGTDTLPVRRGTAQYLGDYFAGNPSYQVAIDLLSYSTSEPPVPGYSLVRALSQQAFLDILGGEDVAITLTRLNNEANQILEEQIAMIPEPPDPWVEVDPSGQNVIFWHQYSDAQSATFEEIVNGFNATNKWGITVLPEAKSGYGGIFQDLLPVLGTDNSPNLVMAYQHQAASYYMAGGLTDLNSLVESPKWGLTPQEVEDFVPSAFEQDIYSVFEGIRLGFPVQRSTDVLYYNTDWLSELGFDSPPSTPEEFKNMACAAVTPFSKSSAENGIGYHFYLDTTRFTSWVFAFGGDVFDEETNRFTYNNDVNKAVTTFILDLVESGCALPITDRGEAHIAFSEGTLLFMVDSSFHIPAVETMVENYLDFNWSITSLPSILEEPQQNIFGASVSIPASSPETELAAWLFIKYLTSPEVQATWAKNTNFLPVRQSAAEYLSGYFEDNPAYQTAFELMPYSSYEPSLPGYDFIQQEVELALEAILGGEEISLTLEALNAIANQVFTVHLER